MGHDGDGKHHLRNYVFGDFSVNEVVLSVAAIISECFERIARLRASGCDANMPVHVAAGRDTKTNGLVSKLLFQIDVCHLVSAEIQSHRFLCHHRHLSDAPLFSS